MSGLADEILLMVGGHQAKAMPQRTLADPRMHRLHALVLGEGETRVAALLDDEQRRTELPGVMWHDRPLGTNATGIPRQGTAGEHLAPNIDELPFVDRRYLTQDPYRACDGRILKSMDKRITGEMTETVAHRLMERGINVKGYFILSYPGEEREDLDATVRHIHKLWDAADRNPGTFRASVFEFRPYPGTPVWQQLISTGHDPNKLLAYGDVDLTDQGADESMRARDEFNFSVGLQFGGVPLPKLRTTLATLTREQHVRTRPQGAVA